MAAVAVLAVSGAVIGTEDAKHWRTPLEGREQSRQVRINVSQGCGLCRGRVFGNTIHKDAIRLMDRRDVDEQEDTLPTRQPGQDVLRQDDLVFRGVRIGYAEFRTPVTLGEQVRQHPAKRAL